jgi:hypothetical protein
MLLERFVDQPRLTEPKLSKDTVQYRGRMSADHRCGTCRRFVPPADCLLVEGQITAQGLCDLASVDQDRPLGSAGVDRQTSNRWKFFPRFG